MTEALPLIQQAFYADPEGYPPIVNGARLLARAGYRVDIFCRFTSDGTRVALPERVRVTRIDNSGASSWREYGAFARQVLREASGDACLFVGHDMHGLLPAWLVSRRYRRPLVYHCHDFAENVKGGGRYVKAFEKLFARTADVVIVPDLERGRAIAKALALKRPPLIVANAPLRGNWGSGEALLQALERQGRRYQRILLRQGSIGTNHALEATIRSIPFWTSREWGLVLIGRGAPEYLKALVDLARELGVEQQLAILPAVSYDEVLRLTPGADAGHALYEPTHINNLFITTASNKLLEYMAAGLPVIVSDRPALRALVERYECGLTADESSPEKIAAAVNALLGDGDLARRLGAAGATAFEEELNYERQFAPVLDAFQFLCHVSGEGWA